MIDGTEHHTVEAFRAHRYHRGYLQYRVKWSGWPEERNTWEFLDDLSEDLTPDALEVLVIKYRAQRTVRGICLCGSRPSPRAGRAALDCLLLSFEDKAFVVGKGVTGHFDLIAFRIVGCRVNFGRAFPTLFRRFLSQVPSDAFGIPTMHDHLPNLPSSSYPILIA